MALITSDRINGPQSPRHCGYRPPRSCPRSTAAPARPRPTGTPSRPASRRPPVTTTPQALWGAQQQTKKCGGAGADEMAGLATGGCSGRMQVSRGAAAAATPVENRYCSCRLTRWAARTLSSSCSWSAARASAVSASASPTRCQTAGLLQPPQRAPRQSFG